MVKRQGAFQEGSGKGNNHGSWGTGPWMGARETWMGDED